MLLIFMAFSELFENYFSNMAGDIGCLFGDFFSISLLITNYLPLMPSIFLLLLKSSFLPFYKF